MRKYKLLLVLLVSLSTISCDGWLDVKPQDEIDEKDLFATGDGYRHLLNGIYYGLSNSSLYGRELTWGIVDALGQCFDFSNTHSTNAGWLDKYGATGYEWENYQLKPAIETMWENSYKMVANCNNLIQNIANEDPEKFYYKEREKSEIWGEALALRAAIQLDMVRLFSASPAMSAERTNAYTPYISEYPSYVSKRLTADSCLSLIIQDLEVAQALLWKADSSSSFNVSTRFENNSLEENLFVSYKRGYRLNYYAATAILARACLYAQKPEKAYMYAKKIIDYQDKTNFFRFYDRTSYGDKKFYYDILWGLESLDLIEYINAINDLTNPDSYYHYYIMVANVKDNYFQNDMTSSGSNDRRYKHWMTDCGDGESFRFSKYEKYNDESYTQAKVSNYLVPMVRMSEVYYIAAEAIYKSNLEEAKEYLRRVKSGRGLRNSDASMQDLEVADEEGFMSVLINDARREWLGEGQTFFMYKRLGKGIPAANSSDGLIPIDAAHAIVPIPATETNLN